MRDFLYLLIGIFFSGTTYAQILFTENFNNYALGEVSTDATGAIPGKGGWYVRKAYPNNPAPCEIVTEAGRGNVLAIGINKNNSSQGNGSYLTQKNVNTLWNNRALGNDILKLEYDIYILNNLINNDRFAGSVLFSEILDKAVFFNDIRNYDTAIPSNTKAYLQAGHNNIGFWRYLNLGKNNTAEYDNFPYNSWITVEFFIDYEYESGAIVGGAFYVYIPALNILKGANFDNSEDIASLTIIGTGNGDLPVVVKFDNIQLTALNTLPTYLGVEDFISQKLNLYPNPAQNVVNITNSENILINHVGIYDIHGKQLRSESFNNESPIQLNIENLSSGTYMLHIETKQGTAIKKLVKQ